MKEYIIQVGPRGFGCSPLGRPAVHFQGGDYLVPDDMPDDVAQRCLRAGRGKIVETRKPPQTQAMQPPETKDGRAENVQDMRAPRAGRRRGVG